MLHRKSLGYIVWIQFPLAVQVNDYQTRHSCDQRAVIEGHEMKSCRNSEAHHSVYELSRELNA